jgi:hypothetical protein
LRPLYERIDAEMDRARRDCLTPEGRALADALICASHAH